MTNNQKLAAIAAILIIAIITAHVIEKNNAAPQRPRTTTFNWVPTQLINNPTTEPTTTQTPTTPEIGVAAIPYSANEIVFTITYFDDNTTVSGTIEYGPAAEIIQEKIYINGTPATTPVKPDPLAEIMDKIAKIITLTIGGSLSNESITILGPEIILNTTNTRALITLIGPKYAYVTYTTTTLTADLRWLKPHKTTPTTATVNLPIVNNHDLNTVYSAGTLTVFCPWTVNGEIVTEYATSLTLFYVVLFNDRIIYNGTLLTPLGTTPLATNATTTATLTVLTENPLYSIPPTITCTKAGGAYECLLNTTTIAFNNVLLSFRYTTVTNGATLTVHGWMAYPRGDEPCTQITVITSPVPQTS